MCEFRIGQKVVCVDASMVPGYRWSPGDDLPIVGEIYTVTGVMLANPAYAKSDKFEVTLAEISRGAHARAHPDPVNGYGVRRFRAIPEHEQDISIFRRMCADATKRVSAE